MYKIKCLVKGLLLLLFQLPTLAYANSIDEVGTDDRNVQFQVANQVLNELKQAKGILPTENPQLIIPKEQFTGSQKLAVANLTTGTITLDPKSYLICQSLGVDSLNALAFILGHELGHFIHSHSVVNHHLEPAGNALMQSNPMNEFVEEIEEATAISAQNFKNKMDQIINNYNKTYNEAEADFEGAFLGYLAGYKPMQAGKKFLEKAYSMPSMNLQRGSVAGYPSLNERLEIIDNTTEELIKLTPIFEMANYLIAVGQYQDAIPYLEEVLLKFQSREIYNNLGVIYLLQIQSLSQEPIISYKLPITLEAKFQAPHPQFYEHKTNILSEGNTVGYSWGYDMFPCHHLNIYQKQLEKAQRYFDKAISLDPNFAIAHLNASITQTLKAKLYEFNSGLYLNEEDSENMGSECDFIKNETYDKALQFAIEARRLALKSLQGITAEYFEFPPSDSVSIESLPQSTLDRFLEIVSLRIDSLGNQTNVTHIYPYKKEAFNKKITYRTETGKPIKDQAYIRWSTFDGKIPEQAINLSNICTQIDIIKILKNELQNNSVSYYSEYGKLHQSTPFARALEIHPKNKLAQFNKSFFSDEATLLNPINQNTKSEDTLNTHDHLEQIGCVLEEKFQGFSMQQVDEIIKDWDINLYKQKERVIPYYTSNYGISEDDLVLKQTTQNVLSEMKYRKMLNFEYFKNKTSINLDNKEEETNMLIPNIDSTIQTICGIKEGSLREDLDTIYGEPFSELHMSNGIYVLYQQHSESNNYVRGELSISIDDNNEFTAGLTAGNGIFLYEHQSDIPNSLSMNNISYFNLNDLNGVTKVDLRIIEEKGIIFKLDRKQRVVSWGLYSIHKKSELALGQR